jgi:hypothetical protein
MISVLAISPLLNIIFASIEHSAFLSVLGMRPKRNANHTNSSSPSPPGSNELFTILLETNHKVRDLRSSTACCVKHVAARSN